MATSPEALLISSVIRDCDYTTALAHGIGKEMFHAYQDEWAWMESYFSKYRKTPTKVAFKRRFPDFPLKMVNDTAHFVDEVRHAHSRIQLVATMSDAADFIADGKTAEAISHVQKSMIQVTAEMGGVQDIDILADWENIFNEVKHRKETYEANGMAGIPTGFDTLDERTGGLQPGQLWIVGARLGEGKSWSLLRMAVAAIMGGHSAHFAALEMSRIDVAMRVHNFLSGHVGKTVFKSMALAQGKDFDISEYREFLRNLKSQIKGTLTVSDNRKIGSLEIASQIERHRPSVYFLDYLTLAKTGGDGGWQDIGKFSKELKVLAGEYQIPIVAAAQLNRENGLGRDVPGAEALAGADAIGQDADAVITLKKRTERVTEYNLAKYRHGTAGYHWHVQMEMTKGIMQEVSYNKARDLMDKDREKIETEKENSRDTKKREPSKPVLKSDVEDDTPDKPLRKPVKKLKK